MGADFFFLVAEKALLNLGNSSAEPTQIKWAESSCPNTAYESLMRNVFSKWKSTQRDLIICHLVNPPPNRWAIDLIKLFAYSDIHKVSFVNTDMP